MKIGIIDADLMDNGTRHPNLALMKISGYYKEKGEDVSLIYKGYDSIKEYDEVYISKVFNFTEIPDWVLHEENVHIGGTGFFEDGGKNLFDKIEHHMPDYNLYLEYIEDMINGGRDRGYFKDYLEYSIGFLTRGCFRKCSFCVNKKYDHVFRHSPLEEFLDESRPKIYLWDDNFLAFPQWEECLDSLEKTGKPFQFRQGIDIRLMDDRKAYRFNNTRWHGDFIFAFDHLEDRDSICKNIQLWKKYTNKQPKLYVLSGFNSQDATDIADVFERISLLMKYGCIPYIMRYQDYKKSKYKGMYIQVARWCNQPQFYKKMSFREFCERNQYYHPNKKTYCSAFKAMTDFENQHPEIAKKYFDLKFMYENVYQINYGDGHRYCNKQECSTCKLRKISWDDLSLGVLSKKKFLELYLEREMEIRCLCYSNRECEIQLYKCVNLVNDILSKSSIEDCALAVKNYKEDLEYDVVDLVLPINSAQEIMDWLDKIYNCYIKGTVFFKDLCEKYDFTTNLKVVKLRKVLHNLAMLDLIYFSKNSRNRVIIITEMGNYFRSLKQKDRNDLLNKLAFRFPLIQEYYRNNEDVHALVTRFELTENIEQEIRQYFKYNNG